jgi:hypothetical protein
MPADPGAEARAGAEEGSQLGARMADNINNSRSLRLAASGGRAVSGALDGKAIRKAIEASSTATLDPEGKQSGARDRGGLATTGWR